MTFCLKNAPPPFQKWIQQVFFPYLTTFLRIFLDEFSVFGIVSYHLSHLRLCFQKFGRVGLALNPTKCASKIYVGNLLGHVFSKERLQIDDTKTSTVKNALPPKHARQLDELFG